jgi:hypothetical protein
MMFTPLEPSAGPIGGAGLAWPPFTLELYIASDFFSHFDFEGLPIFYRNTL